MCSNIILRPLRFIQLITLLLLMLLLLLSADATLQHWYSCLYWEPLLFRSRWLYEQCAVSSLRSHTTSHHSNLLHSWLWGCSQSTIILWNADDTTNWANSYFIWRLKCVSTLIRNWQNTFKCQFGNEFLGSKYPNMPVPDVVWCNPSHCGTEGWYC